MEAVRAEDRRAVIAEREHVAHELELEARYVAREGRAERVQLREAANLERWYYAACGFSS